MPFDPTTGTSFRGKPPPSRADKISAKLRKNRQRLKGLDNKRHLTIRSLDKSKLQSNAPVGVEGELVTDTVDSFWVYLNGTWMVARCFGVPPE